jgi:hypothetical protein
MRNLAKYFTRTTILGLYHRRSLVGACFSLVALPTLRSHIWEMQMSSKLASRFFDP